MEDIRKMTHYHPDFEGPADPIKWASALLKKYGWHADICDGTWQEILYTRDTLAKEEYERKRSEMVQRSLDNRLRW